MCKSFSAPDQDRRKVALLIGNNDYNESKNKLQYAINNVHDLSNKLKSINFDVTPREDLDYAGMEREIKEFAEGIKDGDLVLFYFSGHGCHVKNKNCLIPIKDTFESEKDILDLSYNVDNMINRIVRRQPCVTIMIFDCSKTYYLGGALNCK